MPSDQTEYEIFISYARLDNKPIPADYPQGWVTALREHILADQRRYSTELLRIFFDTSEIKDMDDWRHRILGGLRSSKILLVCLSPNYFKSGPCRWEWDEYLKRQTHQLMGADSIATVYLVEVAGSDEEENAKRLAELMRGNFTDLRPWFPAGPRMLQEAEVKRRLDALGLSLWERIERARRARGVPGNVRRTNPFFVGRREELRRLHEQLGVGAIGVVTAVHGLGGQGKTELAYHYAAAFADWYQAGLWSLAAEGKKEPLPLLAELAFVPQFGYSPTDAEKADATRLGQAVLEELRKRCEKLKQQDPDARAAAAVIILDNVTEPELLSASQLAKLPHPANWLRLVATTRLEPERLAKSGKQLATVAVDSLDENDALALVREHQPGQRFPSEAEEGAAREIVRELGGFTLAVEQAAIYLGASAEHEPPSAFLKRLRAEGLPSVDELANDADVAAQMLHKEKQLAPILRSTLEPLARELPAALTAFQFAALLPPDSVPWPWLKELATRHHPELVRPAEWGKIKRRLEGLRLLTSGDAPEIARVHRLVREVVVGEMGNRRDERRQALLEHAKGRAAAYWKQPWENYCRTRVPVWDIQGSDVMVAEDVPEAIRISRGWNKWEADCIEHLVWEWLRTNDPEGPDLANWAFAPLWMYRPDWLDCHSCRTILSEAYNHPSASRNPLVLAALYTNMSVTSYQIGNLEGGRIVLHKARVILDKIGSEGLPILLATLNNLSKIEFEDNHKEESQKLLDEAQKLKPALAEGNTRSPSPPSEPADTPILDQNVQFTVYRPETIAPLKWYSMLVFTHLDALPVDAGEDELPPLEEVSRRAKQIRGKQVRDYQKRTADSKAAVPRQGEITLVPVVAGIEFNPTRRTFAWVGRVHTEEFTLQVSRELSEVPAKGALTVFLGSIILAEVPLSIRVSSKR